MGQIYSIVNTVNGKAYVGQTTKTFNERYCGGKWWKITSNQHLKKSAEKYGFKSFDVWILEENIDSIDVLNDREIHWANELSAYSPTGYNIQGCGDNKFHTWSHVLPEHWKEKMRIERGKAVICSDGREFPSTRDAAKQLGTDQRTLLHLLRGKLKHYKGLTFAYKGQKLPDSPEHVRDTSNKQIVCSNGKTYRTLKEAEADIGADIASISRCCLGQQGYVGPYTFAHEGNPLPKHPNSRTNGKPKKKVMVGGVVYNSMSDASRATGVSLSAVHSSMKDGRAVNGLVFVSVNKQNELENF